MYVVTGQQLGRKDRQALFAAIDTNHELDLSYYGREAPKNLADHFLKGAWQMTVSAAGPFPAGRPVPLTLTLRNTTTTPLVYGEVTAAGHEHARGITVLDQKGNEVPLTRFGEGNRSSRPDQRRGLMTLPMSPNGLVQERQDRSLLKP